MRNLVNKERERKTMTILFYSSVFLFAFFFNKYFKFIIYYFLDPTKHSNYKSILKQKMSSKSSSSVGSVVCKLYDEYKTSTPTKIKLVDAYMLCIMLTGIIQFVYCCLVGTFPFNAFLSGFISTVASFVLAG